MRCWDLSPGIHETAFMRNSAVDLLGRTGDMAVMNRARQ
jgi:hypothetical protein